MSDQLIEAMAKGLLAGIIGAIGYGIYYVALKITEKRKKK